MSYMYMYMYSFSYFFHYDLYQDIEYSSLCHTIGLGLSILCHPWLLPSGLSPSSALLCPDVAFTLCERDHYKRKTWRNSLLPKDPKPKGIVWHLFPACSVQILWPHLQPTWCQGPATQKGWPCPEQNSFSCAPGPWLCHFLCWKCPYLLFPLPGTSCTVSILGAKAIVDQFLVYLQNPVWHLKKKKKVKALVTQSCTTLCNSMDCSHQAPLSMGFSRQEYWSGLPCPPPGDLPEPGINPMSLMSPTLAGGFYITSITYIWWCYLKFSFSLHKWKARSFPHVLKVYSDDLYTQPPLTALCESVSPVPTPITPSHKVSSVTRRQSESETALSLWDPVGERVWSGLHGVNGTSMCGLG